jgi:hypothetical protein
MQRSPNRKGDNELFAKLGKKIGQALVVCANVGFEAEAVRSVNNEERAPPIYPRSSN